jgi:hypothetical protein
LKMSTQDIDAHTLRQGYKDLRYLGGLMRGLLAVADRLNQGADLERQFADTAKRLDALCQQEAGIAEKLAAVDAQCAARIAEAEAKASATLVEAEAIKSVAAGTKQEADQIRRDARAEAERIVADARNQARQAVASEVEAIKRKLA